MKTIAIIGARLNSSRLPRKHLLDLAGAPLIEQLALRLKSCTEVDKIILATTNDTFNHDLITWAEGKISCLPFDGDVNDLMGRIHAVVTQEDPDYVTYVCGDCPLVEPTFIDHGIRALKAELNADKIELKPDIKSIHEGIEIYSRHGWETLYQASNTPMTREHVGYAHKVNPCLNILHIEDSYDFSAINHRISVDTPSDYRFMQTVYERWYHTHASDSIVDLRWVQSQLVDEPSLADVNQHVQQKSPKKDYKKVALFCHVSERLGMGHLKRCAEIAAGLQEHLGVGTSLHVWGEEKALPWLTSNTRWYDNENSLLSSLQSNHDDLWVLDFHPDHCNITALKQHCEHAKSAKHTPIIAIDKLSALIDTVDEVFIPAFYCRTQHPRISYGWQNYFLKPARIADKKQRILVLTGGSDALHYGDTLPTLIASIAPPDWDLLWVQGPYANAPSIGNKGNKGRWQVRHNPSELQQLMADSRIVATCYGLSLFEAIAAGALTLLLPVQHLCDDDELQALKAQNVCLVNDDFTMFSQTLSHAIANIGHYKATLANAVQTFANTDGAHVFSQHVAALLEARR